MKNFLLTLRKDIRINLLIVFTLALGLGANTTVFSAVNGFLLRSLPFKDPARLIVIQETKLPDFAPLGQDIRVNVCIVGAGIAGMTAAYLLARTGRAIVVIDDGPIAGGETGRTTAHLTAALDDRYYEIEKLHGSDGAKIAAAIPGRSGTPTTESLATCSSCAIPRTRLRSSMIASSEQMMVPLALRKLERTCKSIPNASAISIERGCMTRAPALASSSISG